MATEKFTNDAHTPLNGAINNSVTTLTPTSASLFPTAGNFRIRIDDEIMLVTAVAAGVFTVTRAQEGTAAASHADQATIRHVLTAAALGAATGGWIEVVKTADESVSSNVTIQDDDELFFSATNGVWFEIEFYIEYASPVGGGTPDLKFAIGEDATPTRGVIYAAGLSSSDGAQLLGLLSNNGSTVVFGTAAAKRLVYGKGQHLGGGGTWRFRWAQSTSGVNATTVYATSKIRYRVLDIT